MMCPCARHLTPGSLQISVLVDECLCVWEQLVPPPAFSCCSLIRTTLSCWHSSPYVCQELQVKNSVQTSCRIQPKQTWCVGERGKTVGWDLCWIPPIWPPTCWLFEHLLWSLMCLMGFLSRVPSWFPASVFICLTWSFLYSCLIL